MENISLEARRGHGMAPKPQHGSTPKLTGRPVRDLVVGGERVEVRDPAGPGNAAKSSHGRPRVSAGELIVARGTDFMPEPVCEVEATAAERFATFFTDKIRNPNTRRAYHRSALQFFDWCQSQGLEFTKRGKGPPTCGVRGHPSLRSRGPAEGG